MASQREIFNKKAKLLNSSEAKLIRKVTAAERNLLKIIINKFFDKLETKNGVIVNNRKNINLTQEIERIFKEFNKKVNKNIIEHYGDDILRGQALNEIYFSSFDTDKKEFGKIKTEVRTATNKRLGITPNGKIVNGGFLDSFIKDNIVKKQIQRLATEIITGEVSRKDALIKLKTLVVGNKNVNGKLQNQYQTFIYDTYAEVDAVESALFAEKIGLESAFYLGGTIKTTRKFCCQRNGKLYTVKEINAWDSLQWAGKKPNVPARVQRGGYRCRHRYRYISNKVAVTIRKDLRLDKNGNLIGGKKQPFNTGCDK